MALDGEESKVPYSRPIEGLIESSVVCMLTFQHAAFIVNMPACSCHVLRRGLLAFNPLALVDKFYPPPAFLYCFSRIHPLSSTIFRSSVINASCLSSLGVIVNWNDS